MSDEFDTTAPDGRREIRGWTPATQLPHARSCMRGVINLIGLDHILPVQEAEAA